MTPERWEKIKQIFEAALERTPNGRAAFVAQACAKDDEMRAEVENLISGDARAASFLERPALGTLSTFCPHGGQPAFSTGEIISGRFRVIRFLGKGGMGEVYEAQDLEAGGRLALKTIRPEISSDQRVIARFKQEIQLGRRVNHPNVCRIFDLERHGSSVGAENGTSSEINFFTMELLEGETLAERLKR